MGGAGRRFESRRSHTVAPAQCLWAERGCVAPAGVFGYQPVHEDQVDEVAVAVVWSLWIGVIGAGVQLLRDEIGDRDDWQFAGGW